MTNPKLLRGRASEIDACFAITTVVAGRRQLLQESGNARLLIEELKRCGNEMHVESLAWVVMPDHLHWLLALRRGALGEAVQRMKSRSARAINAVTGDAGAFWQAGFYDHRLRSEMDLIAQAHYIVANPLRRGLVSRLGDYPFWWCKWISREQDL